MMQWTIKSNTHGKEMEYDLYVGSFYIPISNLPPLS